MLFDGTIAGAAWFYVVRGGWQFLSVIVMSSRSRWLSRAGVFGKSTLRNRFLPTLDACTYLMSCYLSPPTYDFTAIKTLAASIVFRRPLGFEHGPHNRAPQIISKLHAIKRRRFCLPTSCRHVPQFHTLRQYCVVYHGIGLCMLELELLAFCYCTSGILGIDRYCIGGVESA